jgi:hypothetical protein
MLPYRNGARASPSVPQLEVHEQQGDRAGMIRILAPVLALSIGLASGAALADRPVTDQERTQLVAALQAEGCTGGSMEFDDGKFEVDDVRCADGKTYDFDFDTSFKVVKKELDD